MVTHEKNTVRTTVSGGDQHTGCQRTDQIDSIRGASGRETANGFCPDVSSDKGRGKSGSKPSVDSTPAESDFTSGLRTGDSSSAGVPSISSQTMGASSETEAGGIMKVCSAVQQKGGVGKSNCIVHLAHAAAEQGLRVLVVDLDTQGNASYTLSPFNTSSITASMLFSADLNIDLIPSDQIVLIAGDDMLVNVESMDMGLAGDSLLSNLDRLSSKFDVCFIDTAPAPGIRMAAALYVSGWVFSPIEVEVYSLLGVKKMLATIENMKEVNPSLQYLGLVPSRYDARTPRQVENLANLREDLPAMVAPVVIHARSSIGDALHYKIPVWQIKKTAARKATHEIRAFAQYILNSMGLK